MEFLSQTCDRSKGCVVSYLEGFILSGWEVRMCHTPPLDKIVVFYRENMFCVADTLPGRFMNELKENTTLREKMTW